jgi:hypothetical protein
MTWPLATHLTTAAGDDPLLNTCTLDWDDYATTHRLPLFEANIFHPAHLSLAYSEHLYGLALFAFPLFAAGVAPLTIHNIFLLLGFAACGYAMFLLARFVTRSTPGAIVGGLAFAFVGLRFHHLPHLQYVWSAWLLIVLLASVALVRLPSWPRAGGLAAALVINGLTSLHWMVFGTVAAFATLLLIGLRARTRDARFWLMALTAFIAAALVLTPFGLPYTEVADRYGMHRSEAEVLANSGRWGDWFQPNLQSKLYGRFSRGEAYGHERTLFPGVVVFALAAAGFATALKRSRDHGFAAACLWLLIGALGALGLHGFFHRFLYEHISAFRGIRMPARWVMVAYVGLDLLAAIGVRELLTRRSRAASVAATAVISTLLLVELRAAPIRYFLTPTEERPVYSWLRTVPLRGAVAELPIAQSEAYVYLWRATEHHRSLINGVSGYTPPHYAALEAAYGATPIRDDFIDQLERLGCSLVIVHGDEIGVRGDAVRQWLKANLASGRLSFVRRFDGRTRGDYVFAVARNEPHAATRADERDSLEPFLRGEYAYSNQPILHVEAGPAGGTFRGEVVVRGWAFAPAGIAAVNLLFDNGRVVVHADREKRDDARALLPWYPNDPVPGFSKNFDAPLHGISGETDLQVEVVDKRGVRVRGVPFWFRWLPPSTNRVLWNEPAIVGLLGRLGADTKENRERLIRGNAAIHDYTPVLLHDNDSDEAFVQRIVKTLLDEPDEGLSSAMLDKLRKGYSRERVIESVLQSNPFRARYIRSGTIVID